MFFSERLLFAATIILFVSCSQAVKQKEQEVSPVLTKDAFTSLPPRDPRVVVIPGSFKKSPVQFAVTNQSIQTSDADTLVQTTLREDLALMEKPFQEFLINAGMDTTILCKEGTVIRIRPNSFLLSADSTEVKGNIILQVKEFYSLPDILAAGLSTRSGGQILETGGMIFLRATSDGETCILKEHTPIQLSFPFSERKAGMQLFAGKWAKEQVNWELSPAVDSVPAAMVEEMPVFPGGNEALKAFLLKNIVYPDSLAENGIGGTVQMDFVIDEKGQAREARFRNNPQQGFRQAILSILPKMPLWQPAKRNGIPVRSAYSIPVRFYTDPETTYDTVFQQSFEAVITDDNINTVSTAEVQQYVFSSSRLGWINCDRFYKSQQPLTDLYVDCGIYTAQDVKLLFHSIRSVLNAEADGGYSTFKNIPAGEAITIVALKKMQGALYISITDGNTDTRTISNLTFEKVTRENLKQKLEQLSSRWK